MALLVCARIYNTISQWSNSNTRTFTTIMASNWTWPGFNGSTLYTETEREKNIDKWTTKWQWKKRSSGVNLKQKLYLHVFFALSIVDTVDATLTYAHTYTHTYALTPVHNCWKLMLVMMMIILVYIGSPMSLPVKQTLVIWPQIINKKTEWIKEHTLTHSFKYIWAYNMWHRHV